MRKSIAIMYVAGAVASLGCASVAAAQHDHPAPRADVAQSGMRPTGDDPTDRIRAATASFKSLDAAEAAGYPRVGGPCMSRPGVGGMGYHHMNEKLMSDDKVDLEHPEVLVYYKTPSGEYVLNGVEYMVLFSQHPGTAEPPTVAGHKLKRFEQGKFWYLHMWAWLDNPSGFTADWNPKVTCS